jgi:hypothetical protein
MDKMILAFNEYFSAFAEYPLTKEMLEQEARGELNKFSGTLKYSLFERDRQIFLAGYATHRMTNARYAEININGEVIYKWSEIEFSFVGNDEANQKFQEYNRQGYERMNTIGINPF